jgi:large subunit ribosomal protein L10
MNQTQKREYVEQLSERLKGAPLVMLADFRGVTVAEIDVLRGQLAAKGVGYEVVKNSLGTRAIAGTDMEGISQWLTGMTGWVIAGDDPIAAAKAVRESTKAFKKEGKFTIKGGFFDGEALGTEAITKVADLPSREELLSTLLRTIQEGPRQLLGVIRAPARDLLYLLKNYESKLSEDSDD